MNYIQILYLCILKQLPRCTPRYCGGCELHSNLVSLHSETTLCLFLVAKDSCELHSNLVSLHSETTLSLFSSVGTKLWITFKSCIFAFWNNIPDDMFISADVVNYIQILYLCILKQQRTFVPYVDDGCELHSNLVSLHSETTERLSAMFDTSLWITFKSCIFAFWNNARQRWLNTKTVVNYIQILYLCILKQLT